jgi:hypothetical protein
VGGRNQLMRPSSSMCLHQAHPQEMHTGTEMDRRKVGFTAGCRRSPSLCIVL